SQATAASQAPPNGISVALAPASASVLLGRTMTLTATVSNTTNPGVSWSVENIPGGNNTVGAITGAGTTATFTAPPSLPPAGSVTVEAASLADPTKIATAAIAITSDVVLSLSPASQAV